MKHKKKILILENDDFLREILGNLLHKKGFYILNGFSVTQGVKEAKKNKIDLIILGTSCKDYHEKHSFHFIKKELGFQGDYFILKNENEIITSIPESQQMNISSLSVHEVILRVSRVLTKDN